MKDGAFNKGRLQNTAWLGGIWRLPWLALVCLPVQARGAESAVPGVAPVALPSVPLHAVGGRIPAGVTLALSVKSATVGAAYREAQYAADRAYVGYFDRGGCYRYSRQEDWFFRYGDAQGHACAGVGFSGNFMNFATASAADIVRLALTGGDRVVDTPDQTVLQRAVLPPDFYNHAAHFNPRYLRAADVAGAIPQGLLVQEGARVHVSDVYIANCLNRVFFGTAPAGHCTDPAEGGDLGQHGGLREGGYFLARVRVCDRADGGGQDSRGAAYCHAYPSGGLKPIGNLQKFSDRVRVAVFAYLLDHGTARYGGVLRAPLKFVGPEIVGGEGHSSAQHNPVGEWNAHTGVFVDNPDGDGETHHSGVANYVNQFGRLGAFGVYKSHGPIGELYYEALRYLQGLPPTPAAVGNIDAAMADQFQVLRDWRDPYAGLDALADYRCVNNHLVLIGDVHADADQSLPGNVKTSTQDFAREAEVRVAANVPNFVEWTQVVAGFERNEPVAYQDGAGQRRTTANPHGAASTMQAEGTPGNAGSSYYLVGAAYWANTHDIRGTDWTDKPDLQRPGMRVKTHAIDVNDGHSSSAYAGRHWRQLFLAAKYGGFTDHSGYGHPFVDQQGQPSHASWSASAGPQKDPHTYYLASHAQSVLDGLDGIFAAGGAQGHSLASGALSHSDLLRDGPAVLYRGQFDAADWSGDVAATALVRTAATQTTAASVALGGQLWSAASQLDTRVQARRIVVGHTDRKQAMLFEWHRLEASLQQSLQGQDNRGPERVAYLAGDRSHEGRLFRVRGKLLGAVVHSGVVYSGAPSQTILDADYYTSGRSVYQRAQNRPPAVFVGANDGMLHAFNAHASNAFTGGHELFAYIPSWLGPHLVALTDKNAPIHGHRSFVDATPVVAEAQVGDGWKTVLVGGTGAGGQGVYALDVSDPAAFGPDNVLWEFTDADDADLGNVMAAPHIVKVRTSATAHAWFALVASGVNNYTDDGAFNRDARPAIFFLRLDKRYGEPWALGHTYFKLRLPVKADGALASGLVDVSLALNAQGALERVYAGDLHGNLWRIVLAGKNLAEVAVPRLPLLIATDAKGARQPITAPPMVVRAANRNLVVVFGTGKYLEASDTHATQVQSFYAVMDEGFNPTVHEDGTSGAIVSRARLQQAQQTSTGIAVPAPFTWATMAMLGTTAAPHQGRYVGWHYPLPGTGERQVSAGQVHGATVLANTLMPAAASPAACGAGASRAYQIHVAGGKMDAVDSPVGVLGSPLVLDFDHSVYSAFNSFGQRTRTTRSRSIWQGTKAGAEGTALSGELVREMVLGRLSWRQIPNYQELRSKAYTDFE